MGTNEKVFAAANVFNMDVLFSGFTPTTTVTCTSGGGTAKLYAVQMQSGYAADRLRDGYRAQLDRRDDHPVHHDRLGHRLDAGDHRDPAARLGQRHGVGAHGHHEPAAAEQPDSRAGVLEAGSLLA